MPKTSKTDSPHALLTSGGKDSTLALDRALRAGIHVARLVNIAHRPTKRVRFHGVRIAMIRTQAQALGLPLTEVATVDDGFETEFLNLLGDLRADGITGVVFGNIHLADVRAWYETRVRQAGLEHIEPLWGDGPLDLLREFVERGYRAVITSVDTSQLGGDALGRDIDEQFLVDIAAVPRVDPCGERGEYHSFVYDGPLFRQPVSFVRGVRREETPYVLVDLLPA